MFGIRQRKKRGKPVFVLCLGFMCVSALTPVSTVFADPTTPAHPNNSTNSSSERLLSKKNCDQIMSDTYYLQLTSHRSDYRQEVIQIRRDADVKRGEFASDARMLPLFNELARDPYSKAVHRKIYRLCGATNFNAHIAKGKRFTDQLHISPVNTDWGM